MDDFFDKIKKKLSVDNILDFMKDGKLKEEIKQTLTAKINLNERPKQDEARTPLEVPIAIEPKIHVTIENIQHSTTEDQSKVNVVHEIPRVMEEKILEETRRQMIVERNQQKVTEEQNKLTKGVTKEQLDDTKTEDKKSENSKIEDEKVDVISNLNVIQKAPVLQPQPDNGDPLNNFEIFTG